MGLHLLMLTVTQPERITESNSIELSLIYSATISSLASFQAMQTQGIEFVLFSCQTEKKSSSYT